MSRGTLLSLEMNAKIKLENHDAQEIKYTTCYMCACRCGIKVTLEDTKSLHPG
jgi:sulfite dehydrogenase (quinone) subunit SoeA